MGKTESTDSHLVTRLSDRPCCLSFLGQSLLSVDFNLSLKYDVKLRSHHHLIQSLCLWKWTSRQAPFMLYPISSAQKSFQVDIINTTISYFKWENRGTERLSSCPRSCPHSRPYSVKWWSLISNTGNVTPAWTQSIQKMKRQQEWQIIINPVLHYILSKENILGVVTGAKVS